MTFQTLESYKSHIHEPKWGHVIITCFVTWGQLFLRILDDMMAHVTFTNSGNFRMEFPFSQMAWKCSPCLEEGGVTHCILNTHSLYVASGMLSCAIIGPPCYMHNWAAQT